MGTPCPWREGGKKKRQPPTQPLNEKGKVVIIDRGITVFHEKRKKGVILDRSGEKTRSIPSCYMKGSRAVGRAGEMQKGKRESKTPFHFSKHCVRKKKISMPAIWRKRNDGYRPADRRRGKVTYRREESLRSKERCAPVTAEGGKEELLRTAGEGKKRKYRTGRRVIVIQERKRGGVRSGKEGGLLLFEPSAPCHFLKKGGEWGIRSRSLLRLGEGER